MRFWERNSANSISSFMVFIAMAFDNDFPCMGAINVFVFLNFQYTAMVIGRPEGYAAVTRRGESSLQLRGASEASAATVVPTTWLADAPSAILTGVRALPPLATASLGVSASNSFFISFSMFHFVFHAILVTAVRVLMEKHNPPSPFRFPNRTRPTVL